MFKQIILLIFFSIVTVNIILADNYIDSLISTLLNANDKTKSEIYLKLIKSTPNDSIKKLIEYGQNADYYSKISESDSSYSQILNQIGLQFYAKSNFTLAEKYFTLSLNKEIELQCNMNIAKMYSNIAVVNELKGDYEIAISKYMKALEYFENENYKKGIAFVYNNLGVVYDEMKRKDEALKYKLKALEIKTEIADSVGMASTLNNLGVIYEELIVNYDSALFYYEKALELYSKINQKTNYAITLQNIAAVNKLKGNLEKSLLEYNEALKIFIDEQNIQGQAWSYRNIGEINIELKNFPEAEKNLKIGLNLSSQIEDKKTNLEITGLLADLYSKTGDYKLANEFFKMYNVKSDSLINFENQNQINELKTKYETSQLEYQIDLLNFDNQLKTERLNKNRFVILGLILVLIFIFVISYFLRKVSKLNSERQKANLEQKVLRLQMNPHFISNALSSIQNFLYENKPQEAANYLSDFSRLMRQTIKSTNQEFVTLEEEIQSLNDYVRIQQLRFADLFDFKININENIETEFIQIPPMIIQPFVENSIKHGFNNINYKGKLEINILETEKNLKIEIIDNGKGIENENLNPKEHISYSMQITKERLKNITKAHKKNASVKIFNKFENNKGVKIELQLPII